MQRIGFRAYFRWLSSVDRSKELLKLAENHSSIIIPVKIDINSNESVNQAKIEVEKKLGNNQGLNCLLNNAAVNKNLRWEDIDENDMLDTYRQNVLGPWRIIKAFLPLINKAVQGERNVLQASIINVSSIISSSTLILNEIPFYAYDYQCSKAALNMFTVCLARNMSESNKFIASLHPGWVKTDMGGKEAPLAVEEASKNIVDCLTAMKDEHYGKLIDSTSGHICKILPF